MCTLMENIDFIYLVVYSVMYSVLHYPCYGLTFTRDAYSILNVTLLPNHDRPISQLMLPLIEDLFKGDICHFRPFLYECLIVIIIINHPFPQ